MKKCEKVRKLCAFTLAEVLITLGVIGVVAAITMPTLIQNHKNQETVTRLQKAISVLNNGMRKMMADEEVNEFEHLEIFECNPTVVSSGATQQCVQPYFKKYFNIVSDNVGLSTAEKNAFYPYMQVKYLKGTTNALVGFYLTDYYYSFVTADGILYCPFYFPGVSDALVDVNGKRGPNQVGRDIFLLKNNNGSYVPNGSDTWDDPSSNDYCNPASGRGYGCAARIVQDGWKIKY